MIRYLFLLVAVFVTMTYVLHARLQNVSLSMERRALFLQDLPIRVVHLRASNDKRRAT